MDSKRYRQTLIPLALLLSLTTVAPVRAQSGARPTFRPAWTGDVTFLATNTLIGGLTAGVLQKIRGGSFQDGFARGSLGGAISYAGRRVAVERFSAAGLLGRQVSAVGASIVRNASEDRPMFSRILVPVGPLLLYVHADTERRVSVVVDAHATTWLLTAVLDDRLDLDWSDSFSAGAPVFRTHNRDLLNDDGDVSDGQSIGGLIVLGRRTDGLAGHDVFAHERVHVLQQDFGKEVWGQPAEAWLGGMVPGGKTVLRFVEPRVANAAWRALLVVAFDLDWADRPWEIEAEILEHR
jgi:hypothetical protein